MAKTMLAKVNVTDDLRGFDEIDLDDVVDSRKVKIISAVADKGSLYLIYTYDIYSTPLDNTQ